MVPRNHFNVVCFLLPQISGDTGELFVSWLGFRPFLVINNPTDIKEILSDKFGHFTKMKLRPPASDLAGSSVATLEGEEWAQRRRIVGPAFLVEKLKVVKILLLLLLSMSCMT